MRLLASASRSPWRMHDPALEPRRGLDEAGGGSGVQAGRIGDEQGQFRHQSVPRELGHRGRGRGGSRDLVERRPDAGLDRGEDRALDQRRFADADPARDRAGSRSSSASSRLSAALPRSSSTSTPVRAGVQRRAEGRRDARRARARADRPRSPRRSPRRPRRRRPARPCRAGPSTRVPLWEIRTRPTKSASFRLDRCRMAGLLRPDLSRSQQRRVRRRAEVPFGSRRRVADRCRTVAAPPTLGPAADRLRGTNRAVVIPPIPSCSSMPGRARPLDAVAVASRARALQPDRRPPRAAPDPARRGPRRRRPRRQPRHRLPGGRRAAGRACRRDAARRDPAGRRSSTRRGGRRRVGTALRHGLHRGRFRGRAVATCSTGRDLAAMFRGGGRWPRAARPLPTGRQDDPRYARARRGRLRARHRRRRDGAEAACRAALRAGLVGMRSTRDLVARRGLALRLGERSAGHLDPGRRVVPAPAARALGGR